MKDSYLGYEQAASLTGISKGTLYSLVSRKAIPFFRVGPRLVRFSAKELMKWFDERHVLVSSHNSRDRRCHVCQKGGSNE